MISLIRSTGVMKGLFTSEEMHADNVKEKEAKVQFLKKLLEFIAVVHTRVPPIRISSIIAGKEADKTNLLLQLLAEAVNRGINNAECVAKVLSNIPESTEPPTRTDGDKKIENGASSKKVVVPEGSKRQSDVERRTERPKRSGEETRTVDKDEMQSKHADKSKSKKTADSRRTPRDQKAHEKANEGEETKRIEDLSERTGAASSASQQARSQPRSPASRKNTPSLKRENSPQVKLVPTADSPTNQKICRPPSATGKRKPLEARHSSLQEQSELEKKTSPVEQQRNGIKDLPPPESADSQLVEGAPSAPPISGLLTENQVDSDDDDSFIIEESGSGVHMARGGLGLGDDLNDEDKQHGILVTKILQSKEELGDGSFVPGERGASKGPAALTVTVDEAARKRERQATEREMERLSQALQSLTRSALPLGKLVDFLQEDLESMQTEYREWKAEDQRLQLQLNMVLNQTDSNLDPLREELRQLEEKKLKYRQTIANLKANIFRNDAAIQKMVTQAVERS
uniref:TRAF3-interacting protein 1 n=2 Tax=Schistocephalus solidus TaxID=70667 RepID=A0A0X3PRX2_SCHSO